VEALADAVGLRALGFGARMIDVLDGKIEFVFVPLRIATYSLPRSVSTRRSLTSCSSKSGSARSLSRSAAVIGGAQDTFYVGNLKGVGRVYQQTFIDTYAKVACAKLYRPGARGSLAQASCG
jgi:hypothetical protein